MPALLLALGLLAVALAIGALDCSPRRVHAQRQQAIGVHEDLTRTLARVGANEAFSSMPDTALVWQATQAHGRDDASRLAWLRRHSACPAGGDCNRDGEVDELDDLAASRRRGNSRWTRHLNWNDVAPRGWPADWNWDAYGRGPWRAHRRLAQQLVDGDLHWRVCDGPVITWDGPGFDRDGDGVPDRPCNDGLYEVACPGALNIGCARLPPDAT